MPALLALAVACLCAAPAWAQDPASADPIAATLPPGSPWWAGALLSVVAGIGLSGANLIEGLTFQEGQRVIGLGMWLGLIMAFNVWFLIWPNQKIALGIVDGTPEQKAKAGTTAMIFSRTNFLLSFPMLYCMIAQHAIGAA